MLQFSEKLYALDVGDVPKEEIPRIIDPNNTESGVGTVVCYYPDKNQLIQLALIIWQVAARDRNALHVRNRQFETAEKLCMKTRNVFISLLLPFVGGDADKARDLCLSVLRGNKSVLDQYIGNWSIIRRPSSVWIDKNTNGIFICENEGRIVVGLNPTNFVFVYDK